MKKAIAFGILLAFVASTYAQNHQVSITAAITNSFKTPKDKNNQYATPAANATMMEIGLGYARRLSKHFYITTGVSYSPKGYNTGPHFTRRPALLWPDYKYYEKRRFHFFEIPVGVKVFVVSKRKYRIGAEAGFANQFLTTVTHTPYKITPEQPFQMDPFGTEPVKPEKQTFKSGNLDESGYREYNIGLYLNAGAHYKFNGLGIGIVLFAKQSLLTSAKKDSRFYESGGERFHSFGIGLNFSYDY